MFCASTCDAIDIRYTQSCYFNSLMRKCMQVCMYMYMYMYMDSKCTCHLACACHHYLNNSFSSSHVFPQYLCTFITVLHSYNIIDIWTCGLPIAQFVRHVKSVCFEKPCVSGSTWVCACANIIQNVLYVHVGIKRMDMMRHGSYFIAGSWLSIDQLR